MPHPAVLIFLWGCLVTSAQSVPITGLMFSGIQTDNYAGRSGYPAWFLVPTPVH